MNATALITGATGGLGRAFARVFAQHGHDLALTGRNIAALDALKTEILAEHAISVHIYACDLSLPGAARGVYDWAKGEGLAVGILVNNAGFGDFGAFASCDWARQEELLRLNIAALAHLTRLFLPDMLAARAGHILNIASIAAFQPGPLMAAYYASKAFVLSFSEALAVELGGTGVSCTALCPGPTKTGFEQNAALKGRSKLFKRLYVADAAPVAAYGYRQMMKGRAVAVPGLGNKVVVCAGKFAPRALVRRVVYLVQK